MWTSGRDIPPTTVEESRSHLTPHVFARRAE
jgi:hypothetical protein